MPDNAQSKQVEDFLKAVYTLQQKTGRASTNDLSDLLSIKAPSVTDMAQRLESMGLLDYQKYRGVALTPAGEEIALRVLRRHRLVELYLTQELGYELHEVHDEADRLEHAVSERFVSAIADKLGDPSFDPHGDPIPAADGSLVLRDSCSLADLPINTPATVSRLDTSDADLLQHMLDRGLRLESQVEVIARDPFQGPLTLRVDGTERVIGYQVAESIFVQAHA